ncbi:MAG: hypothetical protein RLZZ511_2778 [Cyanobacteriota bacterium]|jgi:type I restriction enzyme M protein
MSSNSDALNFQDKAQFIWQVADDILFGPFMHNEFKDVVLPFLVLRRLDCIYTADVRSQVRQTYEQFKDEFDEETLETVLLKATGGLPFYNASQYDLAGVAQNSAETEANFRFYIKSYSQNVRDILENFKLEAIVDKLVKHDLLTKLIKKFAEIDLHPSQVSNHEMGDVYERLLDKFNQFTGETAGHHYTPREIIRLMCNLLFAEHEADLRGKGIIRKVFDPACGTGGMLTIAKEHILTKINPKAEVLLYGQELNEQTYAVAKSDFLVTGEDAANIREGNSFSGDRFKGERFRYMLSNPPFGVNWKSEQAFVEAEAENPEGRFAVGLPRINDGALLFLQHMVSKMEPVGKDGLGSRLAIVFNGSPLFTGAADSGESQIRRWVIEHDWLEAIVALPDQMFQNTGINTYIWILTNGKPKHRRGKVQLINGVGQFRRMRKSQANKRNEMTGENIAAITRLYQDFEPGEAVKIFDNEDFGYRRITVERPLRLNFQVSAGRLARLQAESGWVNLAVSKKKDAVKVAEDVAAGKALQAEYLDVLGRLDGSKLYQDRAVFLKDLQGAAKQAGVKLAAGVLKVILAGLGERDEGAVICVDKDGKPEADPELRDYENVPLKEDVGGYMAREVLPHVPDAWVDEEKTKIGYEIPFTRHFYEYVPPRELGVIEAEIKDLENEIREMLGGVL